MDEGSSGSESGPADGEVPAHIEAALRASAGRREAWLRRTTAGQVALAVEEAAAAAWAVVMRHRRRVRRRRERPARRRARERGITTAEQLAEEATRRAEEQAAERAEEGRAALDAARAARRRQGSAREAARVARWALRAAAEVGSAQSEAVRQVCADPHAFMMAWRVWVPDAHPGWGGAGRRYSRSRRRTLVRLEEMEGEVEEGQQDEWRFWGVAVGDRRWTIELSWAELGGEVGEGRMACEMVAAEHRSFLGEHARGGLRICSPSGLLH